MLKPIAPIAFFALLLSIAFQGRAQDQQVQPSPQQEEARQQMEDMRNQILQNMQQRGIDPMEYFQQMRQQIMDGTLDPADIQQQMVQKGIMDEQMVTRMQDTMQRLTMGNLKDQLKASDEDWKVIQPKLQKVVALQAATGQAPQMRAMAGFMGAAVGTGDVNRAMRELRDTLKDPSAKPEVIGDKLEALRKARNQAKVELAKAQDDLIGVLTARQEGVLLSFGLIR
jgi:hypothetical protein